MFMRGMAERLSLSFDEIHQVWFDDVMHCLCLSWVQVQQDLLRPSTAPNCCYRGRRGAPKWYVFFCQFISNHCVCRIPTTLQIGNTHECTVRRQICRLSRASGVIVVASGPSLVSVVFRFARSWLFCNSGFWLRVCLSHVSGWLTSVEVFAAVPLGLSCVLSCWVKGCS